MASGGAAVSSRMVRAPSRSKSPFSAKTTSSTVKLFSTRKEVDVVNAYNLDKLDGEVEEAFYRRNVSAWREEQAKIRTRIERHEKADQNYIEQGIRLLELARNAQKFYRKQGQAERAALLSFIMIGSTLKDDQVVPAFKPPFDTIHRMAKEARACANGDHSHADIKKQAPATSANACPTLLPLLDELRTYCYEHRIEEIPALLAVWACVSADLGEQCGVRRVYRRPIGLPPLHEVCSVRACPRWAILERTRLCWQPERSHQGSIRRKSQPSVASPNHAVPVALRRAPTSVLGRSPLKKARDARQDAACLWPLGRACVSAKTTAPPMDDGQRDRFSKSLRSSCCGVKAR